MFLTKRGFLLIELLLSMSIIILMIPFFMKTIFLFSHHARTLNQHLSSYQERLYIENFIRHDFKDIRNLTSNRSSSLSFITIHGNTVTYFINKKRLGRRINAGKNAYLTDIYQLETFTYTHHQNLLTITLNFLSNHPPLTLIHRL